MLSDPKEGDMIANRAEPEVFYVLGSNSSHVVQLFGTKTGKAFRSEPAAERAVTRLDKRYPFLDFTLLPVYEMPGEDDE